MRDAPTILRTKAIAILAWTGRAALGLLYPPTCIGCGAATGEPHGLCPVCWSGLRLIERPYGDRLELAEALGAMMVRAGAELLAEADLIVPVPLHRLRLWRRRFNQAVALGGVISARSGIRCDPLLLARIKRTRQQVGLTRAQRQQNLQGAFRVPDEAKARASGKRILLVDDVLTTGSTANAASRALLRAGAARVDVLAFARVVTEA
jgi:ComF family protein